jgi:hypothetical protein
MKAFFTFWKIPRTILGLSLFLFWTKEVVGQAPMTVESISLNKYGVENALVYKPSNYSPAKKYPLLMFYHGDGEKGSSVTDLSKLYNNSNAGGPAYFIAHNQWPDSFYNYKDGRYYQFIVVEPQSDGWEPINQNYPLASIINKYSIDTTRIYMTGLSAGGWTLWNYCAHYTVTPKYKVAAIVPMSMATGPDTKDAAWVVADSIRSWGFGDTAGDVWGIKTSEGVNLMNAIVPGIARFTNTPGTGHGGWGLHYNPSYKELIDGHSVNIYEWLLWWRRRSSDHSTPPVNRSPVVDAGRDSAIRLPLDSILLSGSVSLASNEKISSYRWTEISGPLGAEIISPSSSATWIKDLTEGSYAFQLTVTDEKGDAGSGKVEVTVNPAVNQSPVIVIQSDTVITLPVDSILLEGNRSFDSDGTIVDYKWVRISGPTSFNMTNANSATARITNLVAGTYVFELTVIDDQGATASAKVTMTLKQKPNQNPIANAGRNVNITLPQDFVLLDGSASYDPDGAITKYQWTQLTGPNEALMYQIDSAKCAVKELQTGAYSFKLTVTDNSGESSTSTVDIFVTLPKDSLISTFFIYPNPVHELLHVRITQTLTGILLFRVIDMNGRIIKVYNYESLPKDIVKIIDIKNIPPGIYFWQLVENNQLKEMQKVVKY